MGDGSSQAAAQLEWSSESTTRLATKSDLLRGPGPETSWNCLNRCLKTSPREGWAKPGPPKNHHLSALFRGGLVRNVDSDSLTIDVNPGVSSCLARLAPKGG